MPRALSLAALAASPLLVFAACAVGGSGGQSGSASGSSSGAGGDTSGGTGGMTTSSSSSGVGPSTSSSGGTGGSGGAGSSSSSSSGACPPLGKQNFVNVCPMTNGAPCSQWGDICLGGQCVCEPQTSCKPLTGVACDQMSVANVVVDASYVYWTTSVANGAVMRAPVGGGAPSVLAGGQSLPGGLTLDAVNIYWGNQGSKDIMMAPLGGGAPVVMASGQESPRSLAVDATHVYWTDTGLQGAIRKVPIAGGAVETIVTSQPGPAGIAVDATHVYWTNTPGGEVSRVPKNGGFAQSLATGQLNPNGIALYNGYVYWANVGDPGPGSLMRTPVAGGPIETLANGPAMFGGGVAVDASGVYWADVYLFVVPHAGGQPKAISPFNQYALGVAVSPTNVYWSDVIQGNVISASK